MKNETKFISAVLLRNLFTAITIISIAIFLYDVNVYLFVGGISFLVTFIFQERIKGELETEANELKKAQIKLREQGKEAMDAIKNKVNGEG